MSRPGEVLIPHFTRRPLSLSQSIKHWSSLGSQMVPSWNPVWASGTFIVSCRKICGIPVFMEWNWTVSVEGLQNSFTLMPQLKSKDLKRQSLKRTALMSSWEMFLSARTKFLILNIKSMVSVFTIIFWQNPWTCFALEESLRLSQQNSPWIKPIPRYENTWRSVQTLSARYVCQGLPSKRTREQK